jgi:hypothetical protein
LSSEIVATPLWGKCEDEIHTPKSGNLESCCNPTLRQVWGWNSHSQKWELGVLLQPHFEVSVSMTHTPKSGNLESFETPATSELDNRRQNTSPWRVLYTVGKALKCRCRKWPHMRHLDIWSTSYGQKKGRESNCQFDFRPQKVRNQPNPGVCRWSATHRWKSLEENYKFALDLILIRGLSWELWVPKPG